MAEPSKDLRALYALGAVLLLGAGTAVVVLASKGPTVEVSPPAPSAPAPSAAPTSTSMDVVSDGAPNPVIPTPEPSVALSSPSASGSVVIIDGKAYPVSSIQPGPEEKLTPAEELKRKKRAIEVLDEAITRTEADLAKAQTDGDAKQIQTAKVRLERLREVLAKRKAELGVPLTDAG